MGISQTISFRSEYSSKLELIKILSGADGGSETTFVSLVPRVIPHCFFRDYSDFRVLSLKSSEFPNILDFPRDGKDKIE
jgi:hypothetical protein